MRGIEQSNYSLPSGHPAQVAETYYAVLKAQKLVDVGKDRWNAWSGTRR
jgi:hypothetical protein